MIVIRNVLLYMQNERHEVALAVANISTTYQLSPIMHSAMYIVSTIACAIIIAHAFIISYTGNLSQIFYKNKAPEVKDKCRLM